MVVFLIDLFYQIISLLSKMFGIEHIQVSKSVEILNYFFIQVSKNPHKMRQIPLGFFTILKIVTGVVQIFGMIIELECFFKWHEWILRFMVLLRIWEVANNQRSY